MSVIDEKEGMTMEWWTESHGRIELKIKADDADAINQPGPADDAVLALSREPYIASQLAKLSADTVRECLAEYGAWDDGELADHDQNLQRLLWIAACDVNEQAKQ